MVDVDPGNSTFAEVWQRAVDDHGARPFLVFRGEDGRIDTWTYGEFDRVVDAAAAVLTAHDVAPGDAVHLCLRNSPAFIALWLAVARLGAWMVPVDPASSSRDIATQIGRVAPKVGVHATGRAETYLAAVEEGGALPTIALEETAADVAPGGALHTDGTPPAAAAVGPGTRLAVMFTSGTTSQPKGDPPSHDVIGEPVPGRAVRLVDPTTLEEVEPGTPGMILLAGERGVDLFAEYLDAPETNDRSFVTDDDGVTWFRTGDLAQRTDGGALQFVGRADDVIKVSGENVSLTEVEAVLAQAPGVLEVAVVARPDEIRDVVPVAYVVARDTENPPDTDDLAAWARGQLAPQARPREWHLIDELPRTSVGKVRRFKIGTDTAG